MIERKKTKPRKPIDLDLIEPIKPNDEIKNMMSNFFTGLGIGLGLFLGMAKNPQASERLKRKRCTHNPLKDQVLDSEILEDE